MWMNNIRILLLNFLNDNKSIIRLATYNTFLSYLGSMCAKALCRFTLPICMLWFKSFSALSMIFPSLGQASLVRVLLLRVF